MGLPRRVIIKPAKEKLGPDEFDMLLVLDLQAGDGKSQQMCP